MYRLMGVAVIVGMVAAMWVPGASAQDITPPRILFVSKSESFEHSPIAVKDGKPSVAEKVLSMLAKQNDSPFTSTKDASQINAANLKNYDMVVLYTQGDISKPGKDGAPGIGPNGQKELLEWVENGGRVMGFHAASDTFHTAEGGEISPFIKMLGGEFKGHGGQFVGTVRVVDPQHPAVMNIPKDWSFLEEWYMFKNFNTATIRVLALLEPGKEGAKQEMYRVPPYPIIWTCAYGKGKVYYSALGHRDEFWEEPQFQQTIVDAGTWLMTEGLDGTEPNYDKVVPKADEKK